MNDFVADTHALLWYLTNSSKLGPDASSAFDDADNGKALIHIPAIVIAELFYLNEKFGYPIDFETEFRRLESGSQFILTPFDPEDVLDFSSDSAISEMHDRIIVGVARRISAALLTKDSNIANSALVRTIW